MPRPRPPVDAEGYSRAVFHKRANYDGGGRGPRSSIRRARSTAQVCGKVRLL